MDQKNKIIHKRSAAILDNGKAKLPTKDQLEYGELAINFAKGVETISFKNNNDEIVEITTSTALEGIIESNMQSTQASIDAIYQVIEDNEEIIAASLTDLDDRVNLNNEAIDEIQTETAALETRINTALNNKADKVTVETLSGRVDANENAIASLQGFDDAYKDADNVVRGEFAAADTALKNELNGEIAKKANQADFELLSGRVEANEGAIADLEAADTAIRGEFAAADSAITEAYKAADTTLKNELNGEIANKADKTTVEALDTRLTDLETGVIENEEIVAAALTNLDERLINVNNEFADADEKLEARVDEKLADKVDNKTFETLAGRVDVVQGEDTTKSMREVAADEAAKEVAKVVANAPEDFNTLKEVADWILNDKTGAAALQVDVTTLKDIVDGYTGKGSIKTAVDTLSGRVDTNEGAISGLQTTVSNMDTAYKNADTAIRGEFAAADTALKNELNDEIAKKADKTAVEAFDTRLTDLEEGIIDNEMVIAGTITDLNDRLNEIPQVLENANVALKNELNGEIAKKADKTTVETLSGRVADIEGEDASKSMREVATEEAANEVAKVVAIIEENEEITANLFAEVDTKLLEMDIKIQNITIDCGEF